MKFKFNPITGVFDRISDAGDLKEHINPLTGEFNLAPDADSYKQVFNPLTGKRNLALAAILAEVMGNGYINLTNAVKNKLLELKAYGGTELRYLPEGYTQVEYIQSDGNSYIDLGRKVRSDYRYKISISWSALGNRTFMSSKEDSTWTNGRYLGITYYGSSEKVWYSRGSTITNPSTPTKISISTNTIYNFDWSPSLGNMNINGTNYTNAPGSAQTTDVFETANNMYLFAANSAGTAATMDKCKLYSWQMYDTDGTTLLMDLIPAKNKQNVVGLYDTVSGTFLTNAGSGTFTAGSEVLVPTPSRSVDIISNNGPLRVKKSNGLPLGYTELEYLQGDGSAYIDTKISPSTKTGMKISFIYGDSGSAAISGTYDPSAPRTDALFVSTNSGSVSSATSIFIAHGGATLSGGQGTDTERPVQGKTYVAQVNYKNSRTMGFEGFTQIPVGTQGVNPSNLLLFARLNSDTLNITASTCKIKHVEITDGTIVRFEFVPVMRYDGVLGLYDTKHDTFFTNAGSGSFVAGPATELPVGYQKLEYIETDGNSYIDTGILQSNTDEFGITFQSTDPLLSAIMGAISSGTSYTAQNNLCVTYNQGGGLTALSIYADGNAGDPNHAWNGGDYRDGLVHTMVYKGLGIAPTIDGVDMTQLTPTELVANNPTVTTWLFGRNNTGSGSKAQSGVRILSFYVKGKGNFIPCQSITGVLGMYDTVSKTFFTNSGTGTFTAGPVIPGDPIEVYADSIVTNLLDRSTETQGYYIKLEDGSLATTPSPWAVSDYIPVTKYMVLDISGITFSSPAAGFNLYDRDKILVSTIPYGKQRLIIPEGVNFIRICYRYEPDSAVRVDRKVSQTETIESHSKNLFDPALAEIGYQTDTGGITSSNQGITSGWIRVKSNTKYTLRFTRTAQDIYTRVCSYSAGQEFISLLIKDTDLTAGVKTETFTTDTNAKYIRFSLKSDSTLIQLEEGETATAYQECSYGGTAKAKMLLALGDYKDVQEIISGNITRYIGIKVLDGTESWTYLSGGAYFKMAESGEIIVTTAICSHSKFNANNPPIVNMGNNEFSTYANGNVAFKNAYTISEASWTQFLVNQYAQGTPVIIVYPLITPTTETVAGSNINIDKGDNVIEITQAAIDDLPLSAKYLSI